MKTSASLFLFLIFLFPLISIAEEGSTESLYTITDDENNPIFTFCGTLFEGDEYIASDNTLYRIHA